MAEQLVEEEEQVVVETRGPKGKAKAKGKGKGKAKGKAKAKAATGKAAGKGKVKAKAKGKGKAKAKGKAVARPAPEPVEEEEEEEAPIIQAAPKAKAMGLKEKIMQEIGDRSIDEMIGEANEAVTANEKLIAKAEGEVSAIASEIEEAERLMGEATKKVEEAVGKESIALERLKAAKAARGESATNTSQAEQEKSDSIKALTILEFELLGNQKFRELEEAKKRAQDAADLAKEELEVSKLKEKEAQEAVKIALAEQRLKEDEALREHADADRASAAARKEKAADNKDHLKKVVQEMNELEKARVLREKERQQRCREAAGLGKMKLALTMEPSVPAPSLKRPALPTEEEPGAKAAMAGEDVD